MKINIKDGSKIKRLFWTSFQPMHEHLGFENALSIHDITNNILKKVKIMNGHKKDCVYFSELFTAYIGKLICRTILNPKSKKWYLRGLLCETIQESHQHRVGYYYFPRNKEEYLRIKTLAKQRLTAAEIKYELRIVQGGREHLRQLAYKGEVKEIKDETFRTT